MSRPDGKWARQDGQLKTRGKEFLTLGYPDESSGRSDGTRAKPLSPFFWRGAFGRACRRDFRRGSRVSWRPDGPANGLSDEALGKGTILQQSDPVRTAMNPVRTLVVVWLFSFYFAHEH
jgi:hypothetical protein